MANNFDKKPITLSAVKKHLNIDDKFTEDDSYLIQLIQVIENLVIKRLDLKPVDLEPDEDIDEYYGVDEGVCRVNHCFYADKTYPSKCWLNLTDKEGYCHPLCYARKFGKLYYEPPLLHGMLLLIGNLYANREPITEGTISKIPYTLDYLLEPYKNYRIC